MDIFKRGKSESQLELSLPALKNTQSGFNKTSQTFRHKRGETAQSWNFWAQSDKDPMHYPPTGNFLPERYDTQRTKFRESLASIQSVIGSAKRVLPLPTLDRQAPGKTDHLFYEGVIKKLQQDKNDFFLRLEKTKNILREFSFSNDLLGSLSRKRLTQLFEALAAKVKSNGQLEPGILIKICETLLEQGGILAESIVFVRDHMKEKLDHKKQALIIQEKSVEANSQIEFERVSRHINELQRRVHELEGYEKTIVAMKNNKDESLKDNEIRHLVDELNKLRGKYDIAISRFKGNVEEALQRAKQAEAENERFKERLIVFERTQNKWMEREDEFVRKQNQSREIILMQMEDIEGLKLRLLESEGFATALRSKLVLEKEPRKELFNKQLIESYMTNESEVLSKFQLEGEVHFTFVRKIIEQEFSHNIDESAAFHQKYSIKSFEELRPIFRTRRIPQHEIQQDSFVDKINLSHLKLAKPNLFEIVRARALNMNNDDVQKLLKFNYDIYGLVKIIRGLMDSYWNMMNIYTDTKNYSRFYEFAYVWLGNYHVHPLTCKVEEQHLSRQLLN